jgi:hypothetical protein
MTSNETITFKIELIKTDQKPIIADKIRVIRLRIRVMIAIIVAAC